MMDKQKLGVIFTIGAALLLAGCGQQSKSGQTSNASSSSLLASKSSQKLSSADLTPEETVSLVATYAGNRYGGQWAKTTKQAEKDGLQVNLYSTDKYKLSDNGQGVAYDVTAGGKQAGLVYTLKNDRINLYRNANSGRTSRKLCTVGKQAMVNYVNKYGQAKLVKDLASKAQVVDKRGDSSNSSASNDAGSHKYGRLGTVNVPADMQGTWYSADNDSDSTLSFGPHSLTADGQTSQLYKQGNWDGSDADQSVQDATSTWLSAKFYDVHGLHFLNVRGWTQSAGDGSSFAVHTETIDGKQVKVLVSAGGAGFWTDSVYYQTKDLAQDNADRQFDDLTYQ